MKLYSQTRRKKQSLWLQMIVVLHEKASTSLSFKQNNEKPYQKSKKKRNLISNEDKGRADAYEALQVLTIYWFISRCKLLGYVSLASAREYWSREIEKSTACPLMFPCVTSGRSYSVLGQAVTDRRGSPLIKSWLQRGAVWLVVTTDCTEQIRAMPAMFTLGCALRRESSHD